MLAAQPGRLWLSLVVEVGCTCTLVLVVVVWPVIKIVTACWTCRVAGQNCFKALVGEDERSTVKQQNWWPNHEGQIGKNRMHRSTQQTEATG